MLNVPCRPYQSNTEAVLFACLSSGWATTTDRQLGPKMRNSIKCLSQGHSDALPHRELSQGFTTFRLLARRSTNWVKPPPAELKKIEKVGIRHIVLHSLLHLILQQTQQTRSLNTAFSNRRTNQIQPRVTIMIGRLRKLIVIVAKIKSNGHILKANLSLESSSNEILPVSCRFIRCFTWQNSNLSTWSSAFSTKKKGTNTDKKCFGSFEFDFFSSSAQVWF